MRDPGREMELAKTRVRMPKMFSHLEQLGTLTLQSKKKKKKNSTLEEELKA